MHQKAPYLVWVHLTELRWEYARITQMYPVIYPPPVFPQHMGSQSKTQVEIHLIMGCQTVLDHVGLKTISPTIPCN